MQKLYTGFYIHYLALNRMDEVLKTSHFSFFAMETRISQIDWVLHIPDEHLIAFNDLVVMHNFNLSPMNHSFWVQDRDMDAMQKGLMSKTAKTAILIVLVVLVLVAIAGFLL